ncbi:uncharacterized protein LOC125382138 [Haliotis rufescens]|uniref:uncharacterized protein LOC125382138 n=1 Tax=Haliotis rufescens TaxID=6454 RepID=UPI00201F7B80|nr:uncharacterized protein LOC125382138 [Haliotis rufescens]
MEKFKDVSYKRLEEGKGKDNTDMRRLKRVVVILVIACVALLCFVAYSVGIKSSPDVEQTEQSGQNVGAVGVVQQAGESIEKDDQQKDGLQKNVQQKEGLQKDVQQKDGLQKDVEEPGELHEPQLVPSDSNGSNEWHEHDSSRKNTNAQTATPNKSQNLTAANAQADQNKTREQYIKEIREDLLKLKHQMKAKGKQAEVTSPKPRPTRPSTTSYHMPKNVSLPADPHPEITKQQLHARLNMVLSDIRNDIGDRRSLQATLQFLQRAIQVIEQKELAADLAAEGQTLPTLPPGWKEFTTPTFKNPRVKDMMKTLRTTPHKLDKYDLAKQYEWDFRCVFLKVPMKHEPMICINDPEFDKPMSSSLAETGQYEAKMVGFFLEILHSDITLQAVDLGANIGLYSLAAAAIARPVLAVEPNVQNIRPFHKSVKMNGFQRLVTLVTNCLSDRYKLVQLVYNKMGNLGDTKTVEVVESMLKNDIVSAEDVVRTVELDDLIPAMTFKRAIVKVDVQGDEVRMFRGAQMFFKNIHVRYVLMHWFYMDDPVGYNYIYGFLKDRNYLPNYSPHGRVISEEAMKEDQSIVVWIKF